MRLKAERMPTWITTPKHKRGSAGRGRTAIASAPAPLSVSRRSFIAGAVALVAAPAIVRVASLMQVAPTEKLIIPRSAYLTIQRLIHESIEYQRDVMAEYQRDAIFGQHKWWGQVDKQIAAGAKIGDTIRIRLPADFVTSDGPRLLDLRYVKERRTLEPTEQVVTPLALAAAVVAVAPAVLERSVTRRFWSR